MSKPKPGRAFTIEKIENAHDRTLSVWGRPVSQAELWGITHRVIGHTLGEMTYVATIGSFDECKAKVRQLENRLRRYDFKVIEGG